MRYIKYLLIFVVMIVVVAFTWMNPGNVEISYYFDTRQVPLSIVLVASIGLGAIIGMVASFGRSLKLRHENSVLKRKVRVASQEVNNLRAIPIKDQ